MYKTVRNELNTLIWRAKKEFFMSSLELNKKPNELWKCLKQCDVVAKSRNESFPKGVSTEEINKYFVDMGKGNDVSLPAVQYFRTHKKNEGLNGFSFAPVTKDEVKSAMNEVKSRAVGNDGLSIQMIKAASPYALGAITHLINESLSKNIFPQRWKLSIVHPLPKKNVAKTVKDLRPISILPAMSKILEKIVARQLVSFMNLEKILPETQSGFRKNHSTCTALINLFSDLIDAKDKGRCSSLVLLDYSQAFDSISHDMLMSKMQYFGFGENVIEWVKSYLGGRSQVTRLENNTSSPLFKERGVPQGSCLGPVLFNLYTSDFPSCVQNCTPHLYADDCQLHLSYEACRAEEAISLINTDLKCISKWSTENGLKLNIDKCTVLHMAPRNLIRALSESGVVVTVGDESLSVCDKVKTLGVMLDSDLSFSDHVTHAVQRAIGRMRGLYRYRNMLPGSVKLQIMQSLVLSVFYYCFPAYGNSLSRENVSRIQQVQNAVVRYIFSLRRYDHISLHRESINMLPMETVCEVLTNCMTFKVLKHREPEYLCSRLRYREEVSLRTSTRHVRRLHFPKVRLEAGRKSYSYFGPSMYNALPVDLINVTSNLTFKTKLKNMLLGT